MKRLLAFLVCAVLLSGCGSIYDTPVTIAEWNMEGEIERFHETNGNVEWRGAVGVLIPYHDEFGLYIRRSPEFIHSHESWKEPMTEPEIIERTSQSWSEDYPFRFYSLWNCPNQVRNGKWIGDKRNWGVANEKLKYNRKYWKSDKWRLE